METMPEVRHRRPWTYEHYLLFPDDGNRYEIVDGERFVTPAPTIRHQELSTRLLVALASHVSERRLGHVYHAPCDVVLSETDIVQPDLLFVSNQRADRITEAHLQGAPDLVIEILSATTRRQDELLKRDLYEQHGVLEYWIVDPELETVKAYAATDGEFGPPVVLERVQRLQAEVLAGLVIELDALFEK